jgi:hypothetical protein
MKSTGFAISIRDQRIDCYLVWQGTDVLPKFFELFRYRLYPSHFELVPRVEVSFLTSICADMDHAGT